MQRTYALKMFFNLFIEHHCSGRLMNVIFSSHVVSIPGRALAPVPLSGGGTNLHSIDAVAMVPREPQIPAD